MSKAVLPTKYVFPVLRLDPAKRSVEYLRLSTFLDAYLRSLYERRTCIFFMQTYIILTLLQSLRVKSGYLDHLRQTDLITDRFIPSMFGILRLYDGLAKAVKLDIWAVDEYFLECT